MERYQITREEAKRMMAYILSTYEGVSVDQYKSESDLKRRFRYYSPKKYRDGWKPISGNIFGTLDTNESDLTKPYNDTAATDDKFKPEKPRLLYTIARQIKNYEPIIILPEDAFEAIIEYIGKQVDLDFVIVGEAYTPDMLALKNKPILKWGCYYFKKEKFSKGPKQNPETVLYIGPFNRLILEVYDPKGIVIASFSTTYSEDDKMSEGVIRVGLEPPPTDGFFRFLRCEIYYSNEGQVTGYYIDLVLIAHIMGIFGFMYLNPNDISSLVYFIKKKFSTFHQIADFKYIEEIAYNSEYDSEERVMEDTNDENALIKYNLEEYIFTARKQECDEFRQNSHSSNEISIQIG